MRSRLPIFIILIVAASGICVPAALAGSSGPIIRDAADGAINGHYSAAQVRAALAAVKSNPIYSQYSDVAGVLQAYLSSFTTSGSSSVPVVPSTAPTTSGTSTGTIPAGQLDYTGGQPLLDLALGAALVLGGALLRRRAA